MKIMKTNLKQHAGRTIACALLLSLSLSSFAGPADEINGPVRSSFNKEFNNAQIISCDVSGHLTKLTFKMNGLVLSAFYSDNGDLLTVTRNVLTTQLPLSLMLQARRDYKDYWVTDLFEITGKKDSAYYLTLENASAKIVLKSVDNSTWEIFQMTDKD
jgi:hypothetical protein